MNKETPPAITGDILIVDDTLPNLRALSTMLSQQGYHVRGAANGATALMIVTAKAPDLILLDIHMPEMDGYEVCRRLKADPQTAVIPVIFISALDDLKDKMTAFAVGGIDYITKPFHVEEVLMRVNTHLTLHRLQADLSRKNRQLQAEIEERQQAEQALQKLNQALEERVAQRTVELMQTNTALKSEIGERKEKERALRESEERFRHTFEQAAVGISHTAPDGRILRVNQRFCDILGYSAEELLQLSYQDFTHPDYVDVDLQLAQQVINGDLNTYSLEKRYVHKDGSLIWVNVTISLVSDADGRSKYFIAVVEDIDERKQLEEAMRRSQKLESLGVLAGGIAHDFNNLLTAILAETSLAVLKTGPEDRITHHLQKVMQVSERSAQLTRQLLAYAGKGKFERMPLHLNSIIEDNFALLGATLSKSVTIETDLAPQLPPVEADEGQIQQVIMNLIINAAEAYEDQPGTVWIQTKGATFAQETAAAISVTGTAQLLPPGPYVQLKVSDEGKGMDAATLAYIFEPFFTTKLSGRGLGLSAVKGIIQEHNGAIGVDSAPDQGTTFTVWLPASPIPPSTEEPYELAALTGSGCILIIEDEPIIRTALVDTLALAGFTSYQAENGQVGLNLYQSHEPEIDLVILDMAMPVMNGREALAHLKSMRPDLPVILLSGYGEGDSQIINAAAERVRFLQKPFNIEKLIALINEMLEETHAVTKT